MGTTTATIEDKVTGSSTSSAFSLAGSLIVTVPGGISSGNLEADITGVAPRCQYGSHQVAFEFAWQTGTIKVLDTSGCTEDGF